MRQVRLAGAFLLLAAAIISMSGCGREKNGRSVFPSAATATVSGKGFSTTLVVEPRSAPAGRPISLTLVVKNASGRERSFELPDARVFDFTVYERLGGERWRWSEGLFFAQVLTLEDFSSAESRPYKVLLSTEEFEPGDYTVEGMFFGLPELRPRADMTIIRE